MDTNGINKRARLNAHRAQTVLAMSAAGLSQKEIATKLNVSSKTIQRDVQSVKPTLDEAKAYIEEYQNHFDVIYPLEDSALDYVELATNAKNEAVRLGAQQRIDDLRGIVTEKERIRAKQSEVPANQPMFVFQAGAKIDFGGVRIQKIDTPPVVDREEFPASTDGQKP